MSTTEREIAHLALQPTAEGLQALKRIIRRSDVHAVLRAWGQDLLLLWDRGFLSYQTVAEVRQRQAHLLARIKKSLAEVAEEVLEPRRERVNPRVIKRQMSNWRKQRPEHRRHPQPTMKFRHSLVINH